MGNVEPGAGRDVAGLRLPVVGRVVATDETGLPFTVVDATGGQVEPISEFVREMSAGDMPDSSCRSYAFDLLRWWRFLAAIDVEWDRAQRRDVRDLVLWLRQAPNPQRVRTRPDAPTAGSVNPRTGKQYLGEGYAPRTINHQLAVLKQFYDFQLGAGHGPVINPVPAATRGGTRPGAHGNPLLEFCGDVIRPGLPWMLTRTHRYLASVMAQVRDPAGFTKLAELAAAEPASSQADAKIAATRIATILACKGGAIADISVGDCVELVETMRRVHTRGGQKKVDFYLRLRALGVFSGMRRTASARSGWPAGG